MKLTNLKVGTRLACGFAVVALLSLAITAAAIVNMKHLNGLTEGIVKNDWVKIKLVVEALDNTRGSMARVFQMVISNDKEKTEQAYQRYTANRKKFVESLEQVTALIKRPEAKELLARPKPTARNTSPALTGS